MWKLLVLSCVVVVALARPENEFYDTRYDNFDAQELVDNIRLLKSYGQCFLEKGPCTPEGNDFKKIIPGALRTSCSKCSPKQRELIRTVIKGFQSKLPDLWKDLVNKEDPNGEFKVSFEQFINASD